MASMTASCACSSPIRIVGGFHSSTFLESEVFKALTTSKGGRSTLILRSGAINCYRESFARILLPKPDSLLSPIP